MTTIKAWQCNENTYNKGLANTLIQQLIKCEVAVILVSMACGLRLSGKYMYYPPLQLSTPLNFYVISSSTYTLHNYKLASELATCNNNCKVGSSGLKLTGDNNEKITQRKSFMIWSLSCMYSKPSVLVWYAIRVSMPGCSMRSLAASMKSLRKDFLSVAYKHEKWLEGSNRGVI